MNLLAIAVSCAFASLTAVAMIAPSDVLAAEPASNAAGRNYAISAGKLSDVLAEFAATAGVQLVFDPQLLAGRNSSGLKGQFDVREGFSRLLGGTGLEAYEQTGGSYGVREAAKDGSGAGVLPAVTVNAQADKSATTEGTGSYTTGSMNSGTKLALSMRETPQSVSVMTRQQIEDQHLQTIDDAVEKIPGLIFRREGTVRPQFYARGFQLNNLMYDGLPTSLAGDYAASEDLVMYDHIEIVRGATGLMQGAGTPSASLNLVRKRPTNDLQANLATSVGSWDNYRTEFDLSNALNTAGTLRGRVVGAYQNKQSFQNYTSAENSALYGILEADVSKNTRLTLGASSLNENNNASWEGASPRAADGADLNLPRSTYLGNDWEYWNKKTSTVFTELEHRFANDWKLRLAATRSWTKADYLGTYLYRSGSGYAQGAGLFGYDYDQTSVDGYLSGPFQLFGRTHELVVGGSQRSTHRYTTGGYGSVSALITDPANWDYHSAAKPDIDPMEYIWNETIRQKAMYVTSRFKIADPLTLILGGRLDWYDYNQDTTYGGSITNTSYKATHHFTRFAGLVADINKQHSVYGSYSEIFQPQNYLDINSKIITPIVGKNYEVGVKGEYFDGRLNASAAVFVIDQENRAKQISDQSVCPTYPASYCYEAAGKVRSKGIDLELNGELTPRWQLGAGYSYVQTKYVADADAALVGTTFDTDLPRHIFKLSTTYRLAGALERWRVGGSAYSQNTIYNKGTSYLIEQKGYTLLDLMLGYQINDHIDAQLNINNVFDKRYYESIGAGTGSGVNYYGRPRNFMLSVRFKL